MTLRHIVSWKLNGATREERDAQADRAIAALVPLRESVPTVRALSVHRNELFDGANFDLTLVADFDNAEGLEVYASHPTHLPVVVLMQEIAAGRTATDFTL